MGNPLGGPPIHATEKNICHLYIAFLDKGCKSRFDTISMFYKSKCHICLKKLKFLKVKDTNPRSLYPSFERDTVSWRTCALGIIS